MRHIPSVALLVIAAAASPASADELILTVPALAQFQPVDPATLPPGPQPIEPIPPLDTTGEVIKPIEPQPPPAPEPGFFGSMTGVQWLGIGVAVLAVGALAAGGGGDDEEPQVGSSGAN